MTQTDTATLVTKLKPQDKPHHQSPYNVILLDDDDHTFDYVTQMLQQLFGHPREESIEIAKEVDLNGSAIVLTTTRDHAQLNRDEIHGYGPDKMVDGCKGSMSAIIEPVGQK